MPAGTENVTLFTPSGPVTPLHWASGNGVPVTPGRHYVQDKGRFPSAMLEDLLVGGTPLIKARAETKAGILPYLTLAAGVAVVLIANYFFKL